MSKIAEVLEAAKAKIATPETWGQGEDRSCMCAVDAVYDVVNSLTHPDHSVAVAVVDAANLLDSIVEELQLPRVPNLRSAAAFNDHPETRHEDVMALFHTAITKAKAGEL